MGDGESFGVIEKGLALEGAWDTYSFYRVYVVLGVELSGEILTFLVKCDKMEVWGWYFEP